MPNYAKDMIGLKFGRLTVVERMPNAKRQLAVWKSRCDCGNFHVSSGSSLRRGMTIRCSSCYSADVSSINSKHGESNTYLYQLWINLKRRCFAPNRVKFEYWGGRGISVYAPWIDDYAVFSNYVRSELGERPSEAHSLDRCDNDGDYEPGNLRWATSSEQTLNSRQSVAYRTGRYRPARRPKTNLKKESDPDIRSESKAEV